MTKTVTKPMWLGPRHLLEGQAQTAGGTAPQGIDVDTFDMDTLAEAISAGQLGSVGENGTGIPTLLTVLQMLGWQPDLPALARAMPHLPDQFGLTELRDVARTLGYTSNDARLKGAAIRRAEVVTLVVETTTRKHLVVVRGNSGATRLRNPVTGEEQPLRDGATYAAVTFAPKAAETAKARASRRWTADVRQRFSPEIQLLMGLMLVSNLLAIAASFWIMSIFDTAIPAKANDTLVMLMMGLAGIFITDLTVRHIRARIIGHISGRLEYILGTAMFSKLLSFPIEMVASSPINDQISRLKQFETIRDFFNSSVVAVLLELPFLILLLGVIFWLNPLLGGIATGLVVFYAVLGAVFFPSLTRASANYARHRSDHMTVLLETLDQRKTIVRAGMAEVWARRLDALHAKAVEARMTLDRIHRLLTVTAASTTPFAAGTMILIGATLVMQGQLTGGALVAVTILVWRLLAPVQQGLMVATRLPDMIRLLNQIDTMMRIGDVPQSTQARSTDTPDPHVQVGSVFLRYPGSAVAALAGIEFEAKPGQFIGITGPSGSGKTTLLRSISGHYAPQSGTIKLGGTNIRQLGPEKLAKQVAYVTEKSIIFHGTLAQNLRLAAPQATDEDLRLIAEELGYIGLVNAMPDGFDTRLDFARSSVLTPGFKAMIAVSQAFLRAPGVILLDEPTAKLGEEADAHLMAALARRRGKMTILMVSHRQRHLDQADLILSLANGRQTDLSPPKKRAG